MTNHPTGGQSVTAAPPSSAPASSVPALPIPIMGAPGSPYTRKMLAVLRYRRIPYRFIIGKDAVDAALPKPKVDLLPTFFLPDSSGTVRAVVDSTPIIRRLEREIAGRSVLPADPVIGFIDALLEDYADEWLTKAMFHYRWRFAADIDKAGEILPRWRDISGPDEKMAALKAQFSERQISRLHVVGSNDTTAPVIEASYERFVDLLESHLREAPFLMGQRPGASDFAVFGQLTQLAHFDPTPAALTLSRAPRVYAWVGLLEDLSGREPDESHWLTRDAIPGTLIGLLRELSRTYLPVMLANERALLSSSHEVKAEVDGRCWVQRPFPYQGKCLQWLREAFAALSGADQIVATGILREADCELLLEARRG